MRPGIEHIVFTLENSIVVGSHFVSAENLERSMYSGLREHYWGKSSTNTEHHVGSEVILYRSLEFYHDILKRWDTLKGKTFNHQYFHLTHLNNIDCSIPDNDLAALIIMALDPELFTPQEVSLSEDDSPEALVWPDTIYKDRKRGKFLACYLLEAMPQLFNVFYKHRMNIASYIDRQKEAYRKESSENSDSESSDAESDSKSRDSESSDSGSDLI